MAMSASDYLNSAESQNDMAMKAHDPQRESLSLAAAQVVAIQAIAAAVEPASGCDRSHRWAAMSKGRRDREHDRGPGWTAAADQAEAQAAEVTGWARSAFRLAAIGEAATTGRPPEAINEGSGIPRGPLGEIVASVTARAAAGELTVCQHGAAALSPRPPPPRPVDALIWLSWAS